MCRLRNSYASVTDRQTDRQTDAGQSDPYVSLCFAGDTKIELCSLYLPGRSTQGSYVITGIQSLGTIKQVHNLKCKRSGIHRCFQHCSTCIWRNYWDYNFQMD